MRHRLMAVPLFVSLGLIYLPLVSVVMFSFNASSAPIMPLEGLTTRWYGELFNDEAMRNALWVTLRVGVVTVVIVLLLTTTAALAIRGRRFRGRGLYEAVIGLPFLLPEIVTGIALLTLFNAVNMELSLTTIVLGHVLFCMAAGFRIVAARAESLPISIEEASRDLGRTAVGTFWYVTLPALRSALVTAGLLVFALSFDQTVVTILVAGAENTLPTLLWAKLRLDTTPEVNALATLILAFSFVIAVPLGLRAGRDLVG